ncbi:translation initiation factor IF-2 [Panicum miliaceum]|uniref:Translation initiation factor IF-2 n=1 Tax=Panicum miliaceum TaxID=4540 RepID=A0A3L6RWR2_PANMI|nr:translation initiation factor IF-2 [Panicum miliaceum]
MRGIGAAAAAARRHTTFSSSYAPAFSSFSGIGGGDGGFGRWRGRGLPPSGPPRAPGRPISEDDGADPFSAATPVGRGRGEPVAPSSQNVPSFAAFSGVGRGRGSPLPPPPTEPDDAPPRRDPEPPSPEASSSSAPPLPRALPFTGAGRGVPRMQQPPVDKPPEENRFIRRREAAKQAAAGTPSAPGPQQPKLSGEEAVKRALELLGGGGGGRSDEDGGGRGGGGRGFRGRAIYLGDNADGERLEKKLGEDKMKILEQAFMEAADSALPHPMEDAYLEACHTNNMIEFEPQYHVNFANPDIDEKPPMSLEEILQKVKPFIVAYEGIQNQEEWEEAVKDVMARAPHMKELIDMYSGPDVVTAKQQEEELQRVANTLPENIPSSVKRFTDKTLLSLKNNPGWGFDKKCQFMDKFTRMVSEQYK